MLRMPINKTYHQENEFCEIVISENNQNSIAGTFISMKVGAAHNETIPAISFDRFHEYVCIRTRMSHKYTEKATNLQHLCEAWKSAKHSPF